MNSKAPRWRLAGVSFAAMAAIGLSFGFATPAQAAPTGCYQQVINDQKGAYDLCSGGTGSHRVGVVCSFLYWPTYYVANGNWQSPTVPSYAFCNSGYRVTSAWTETQG
jgi:hypothetical protein